jgi:hypothetical protein
LVHQVAVYLSAPRDPGCVARAIGNGAVIGSSVGAVIGAAVGGTGGALAGAPAAGIGAIPGAAIGGTAGIAQGGIVGTSVGGAIGGIAGGILCSSGTWGGSGGGKGGDYRPKTPGANARDGKGISDAARQAGIDRNQFGKFVERVKKLEGKAPSENFTFEELKTLAQEFKLGRR